MNRKDVDEKVNKSYHGCESFFSTVLDGYVVYAAIKYFGMTTPDGTPSKNATGPEGSSLFENVGEMVDKFVLLHVQPEELLLEDAIQSQDDQCQPRYKCRYPTCRYATSIYPGKEV